MTPSVPDNALRKALCVCKSMREKETGLVRRLRRIYHRGLMSAKLREEQTKGYSVVIACKKKKASSNSQVMYNFIIYQNTVYIFVLSRGWKVWQ